MKTETVGIAELENGNKVLLMGRVFEVDYLEENWGSRSVHFFAVDGSSAVEANDMELSTTFEKVVPDPEEFCVRSVAMPLSFWVECAVSPVDPNYVIVVVYSDGEPVASMAVDKADLKAVVEKL